MSELNSGLLLYDNESSTKLTGDLRVDLQIQ